MQLPLEDLKDHIEKSGAVAMERQQAVELVASSQSSVDAISDEHISVSDAEEALPNSNFWVHLLREHTRGYDVPSREVPISLISCCTGSFAEAAVLKERCVWCLHNVVVAPCGSCTMWCVCASGPWIQPCESFCIHSLESIESIVSILLRSV